MAVPTIPVKGISAIITAAKLICRLNGIFRPAYLKYFTGPELAALDALTTACTAFTDMAPFGG